MFELLGVQLSNLISSTRRMGVRMRKLMMHAEKSFHDFDEHLKELDRKVQDGDADGVFKYFELQVKDIENTADMVLETEELDTLYTYKLAQEIKEEIGKLKETSAKLLKLKLDPGLFLAEDTRRILESKGIRSEKDFQKYMHSEYSEFAKEVARSHDEIAKALAYLENKTIHQRWGEMIDDYLAGVGFASYKALQAGRGLRFSYSTVHSDVKSAERDISSLGKFAKDGVIALNELKDFFKAEEKLKESLKGEAKDLARIVEYVTNIINYCVYLFFEVMKQYRKVQEEQKILEKQKFPAAFMKKMTDMLATLDKHITEKTLKTRRAASSARGQG